MTVARITKTLTLTNKVGLHARPAALLVQTAAKFVSAVQVRCNGHSADAKRILQVLQLGVEYGSTVEVEATGDDAEQVVAAIEELVATRFGEPE
jgi:phosphotransferase system HPr (HPr) family protein